VEEKGKNNILRQNSVLNWGREDGQNCKKSGDIILFSTLYNQKSLRLMKMTKDISFSVYPKLHNEYGKINIYH